jgi:hypothetical protein
VKDFCISDGIAIFKENRLILTTVRKKEYIYIYIIKNNYMSGKTPEVPFARL